MDESAETQDSIQISEELQLVTACLIGQSVIVQTKSFLLHGMLEAASFDKDYGILLNVGGQNIRIFLRDIAYISAKNVSLDLNKDAMLESCTKENLAQTSAGQLHHPSGEITIATVPNATSMPSSTVTGTDQMGGYTYPLNSISQPMMPIMQPAQTDNCDFVPVGYPAPINYGIPWQYPNTGGQFATHVPPHYTQAAQPIQDYVPHQGQGYIQQPQYSPRPQNFDSLYQPPRGHQGPR